MIFFPIIISAAIISFLLYSSISNICKMYNVKMDRDPVKLVRHIEDINTNFYLQISNTITNIPKNMIDINYLKSIDKILEVNNSGILVILNNSELYTSENIKKLGINATNIKNEEVRVSNRDILAHQWLIKDKEFSFENNYGIVYIITDTKPIVSIVGKLIWLSILSILLSLFFADGILTYIVSKSILVPIDELKKASFKIKEGNLDFNINVETKDELGELCTAFEEMRCKLKESIDMQLQYENNRKVLISNISHDLKTPVTAVKGYIEGIMDGVADTPKKMERYTKTIYAKATAMDKLIDELFLFSKLDLNKLPFNFEKVDISNYLTDCAEELQFDLEKRGIKLCLSVEIKEQMIVLIDRERIKRVIINLVDNAVKYMDKENGIINIYLTENGNDALVQVQDNGKGISKESLPFIFDRFYRADSSRNSSTGGSGLGLAIAKMIIEEHGGTITAESKEDEGTTICFTLKRFKEN